MTSHICIFDSTGAQIEHFVQPTMPEAAEAALAARGVQVTAEWVNDGFRDVYRSADPVDFWILQMSAAMGDNEAWGYGATAEEARRMAQPEADA